MKAKLVDKGTIVMMFCVASKQPQLHLSHLVKFDQQSRPLARCQRRLPSASPKKPSALHHTESVRFATKAYSQRLLHLGALLGELAQAIVARKRVPLVSVMNEGYFHFTAVGWLVKLLGTMNIGGSFNLCALIMTSRVSIRL